MTFNEEQVEWIVQEVIRRLGIAAASAPHGEPRQFPASDLSIEERVVTMRLIDGRLNGVSRLIVPKRAVVTPAVKDELKARKIQLVTSTSH